MTVRSNKASRNTLPSAADFLKLSRVHSLVPVYRTVTADLETPVSAFLRIAAEEPEAFLLESVEGGEHVGRYTLHRHPALQEAGLSRNRHHPLDRQKAQELHRRHLRRAKEKP